MKFIPKNRDDIFRYFKGTYVKFKEYGDELFHIDCVDQMKISGTHESGSPFILYLDDDTPYDCEYILPHKSFFQFGAHAIQLARIPAKQYHRGLCNANTVLMWLDGEKCRQWQLQFDVLKAYVNKKKFFTLSEATSLEGITYALSPRMMYQKKSRTIFMDFTPIAKVTPNKRKIAMLRPIFHDEVTDWLKKTGEEIWEIIIPPAAELKEAPPAPEDPIKKSQKDLLNALKVKHGKVQAQGEIAGQIIMDDFFMQGQGEEV